MIDTEMKTLHTPKTAAVAIRQILKARFPGTKFSVRTEYFSMGNAIRVIWSYGPTTESVDRLVSKYEYGRFDGSQDLSYSEDTLTVKDGELCKIGGAKYVTCTRHYDEGETREQWDNQQTFFHRVMKEIAAVFHVEYAGQYTRPFGEQGEDLGQLFHQIMSKTDLTHGYHGVRRTSVTCGRAVDLIEAF